MNDKNNKKFRLGILSNEFFDANSGRMGGFGWAAHKVINYFTDHPEHNVELVLLSGNNPKNTSPKNDTIHGVQVIHREKSILAHYRKLKNAKLDLILTIDYRSSYRKILYKLPLTPVVIWVRDPRTMEDVKKVQSIRFPGNPDIIPHGLEFVDCTSLAKIIKRSNRYGRRITFAATTPYLLNKIPETYGCDALSPSILPNIIDLNSDNISKSRQPEVVFLGRLDPYKRPWLFAEIARHFPDVKFTFLGQAHFDKADSWQSGGLPKNIKFAGHVGEEKKRELLSRAWLLINTSAHEGLAVSFLEALKMETPILSTVNPENVVSRFGIHVGNFLGEGAQAVPYFIKGLKQLLDDRELRETLGREGRIWVENVHNSKIFYSSFVKICDSLGRKIS